MAEQNQNTTDDAVYEVRARILKAMAHPSRLLIIDALAEEQHCVCELQEMVGSAMPTVSRHLSQMKNAGIVAGRRDGNKIYYRLTVPCVPKLLNCVDEVVGAEQQRLAEACRTEDD